MIGVNRRVRRLFYLPQYGFSNGTLSPVTTSKRVQPSAHTSDAGPTYAFVNVLLIHRVFERSIGQQYAEIHVSENGEINAIPDSRGTYNLE